MDNLKCFNKNLYSGIRKFLYHQYVFLIYNVINVPQWYAVQGSPDKNRD